MAKKFYTDINLKKNELQNAAIENLAAAPSDPVLGQLYFNTTDNEIYVCVDAAAPTWESMGGDIESVTAGAGLTGGGTDGAVTLDVGQGTGITVNADEIKLKNADSLTDDTVVKWDDTNGQLVDTVITDDGTNVGINNTSPSVELDVTGDTKFSGDSDFLNGNYITKSLPSFSMGAGGVNDEYLVICKQVVAIPAVEELGEGESQSDYYQDATGVTGRIYFSRGSAGSFNNNGYIDIVAQVSKDSGNVNNFDLSEFKIVGDSLFFTQIEEIDIDGTKYLALKARASGGGSVNHFFFVGNLSDDGADTNILTRVRASDSTVTVTDPQPSGFPIAPYMRQDEDGNVGIGTGTPSDKLDVHGIIAVDGAALIDKSNNTVTIGDVDGVDDIGFLDINTANASTRIFLDDSGNVGINTSTPLSNLHIVGENGTARIDNTSSTKSFSLTTMDSNNRFRIYDNTSDAERLTITSGGSVGINTSSPAYKLDVDGNLRATAEIISDSYIRTNGGNVVRSQYDTDNYSELESNGTGGLMSAKSGGTVKLYLSSYQDSYFTGGKVLIGTASSIHGSADLQIVGATGNYARIAMKDSDGTNQLAFIDEIEGSLNFTSQNGTSNGTIKFIGFNGATSSTSMIVAADGNVGIGTASPSQKLEVSGQAVINGGTGVASSGTLHVRQKGNTSNDGIALTSGHATSHRIWKDVNGKLNFGPSTAASSFVQDLSGNIGIGTTSPTNNLHVVGNARAGSLLLGDSAASNTPATILHLKSSGTNAVLRIEDSDGNNRAYDFLVDYGNGLYIKEESTTRMFFQETTGNIGIGTTSPGYKLDINGSVNIASAQPLRWGSGDVEIINSGYNLIFKTYDGTDSLDEHMRITSSGDVGIGTTSPNAKLDVNNSAVGEYAYFGSGLTRQLRLSSYNTVSDHAGHKINASSGNGEITLATNSIAALTVKNDQTIQLNAYGTGYLKSDASGNITVDSDTIEDTLDSVTTRGNTTSNNITVGSITANGNITTNTGVFYSGNGTKLDLNQYNAGYLRLLTDNTERLRVTATGNVGIGTTSPSQTFTVEKNSGIFRINTSTSTYPRIEIGSTSGGTAVIFNRTTASQNIIFGESSDTGNYIFRGGNVGIGTTSPSAKLSLEGGDELLELNTTLATGSPYLNFQQAGTRRAYIQLHDSGNNLKLASEYGKISLFTGDSNNEVERLTVTSAGNVGIGTSSPGEKLQVNSGNIKIEAGATSSIRGLIIAHTGQTGNQTLLVQNSTNSFGHLYTTERALRIEAGADGGTGANETLDFWVNGSERMMIDTTGNVGIGTASPSEKLHVVGDTRIEGNLTVNGTYTQIDTDTNTTEQWNVTNDGTGPAVTINQTGAQDIMDVQDDGTSVFYIEDGGNVGIGTTNPTTTLDVRGDVMVESENTPTVSVRDTTNNLVGRLRAANSYVYLTADHGDTVNSSRIVFQVDGDSSAYITNGLFAAETSVQFTTYGSGSETGTAAYALAVDSSGNVIETAVQGSPTGGSGTAGKLTKWDTSSTLTDSVITESSGSIGIGVSSPSSVLHIKDDTSTVYAATDYQKDFIIERKNTSGDNQSAHIRFLVTGYEGQTTGEASIGVVQTSNVSSGHIVFTNRHNGTRSETVRIQSDGKVLIGSTTTAFSDKLYVNGDAYATGGWRVGSAATYVGRITNGSGALTLESDGNRDIKFGSSTNGTKMYIDTSSGNVGIGTTSPSSKLQISGGNSSTPATALFSIQKNEEGYGLFSGVLGSGVSWIQSATKTQSAYYGLSLQPNGGNVGIGTTSPISKLHIVDATNISAANSGVGQLSVEGSGYTLGIALDSTKAHIYHNSSLRDLSFGTNESVDMTIEGSTGNVGIGTTSPAYKLDVNGDGRITGMTFTASGAARRISTHSAGGVLQLNGGTSASDGAFINIAGDSYSTGDYVDIYAGKTYFSGNVGIGSSTPNNFGFLERVLHISAGSASSTTIQQAGLVIQGSSDADDAVDFGYLAFTNYQSTLANDRVAEIRALRGGTVDKGELTFLTADGSTVAERMRLGSSGNLGINTASPSQKLDVNGNALIRNTIYLGDDIQHWGDGGTGMFFGTDTISFKNDGGSTRIHLQSGGNVGIGTTSPSTSLHVVKDASWEVARFEADSYPTATVYSQAAAKYAQLNIYDTRINSEPTMELRADTPHFNIRLDDTGNVLTILDGGNVGIGTTSPSEALHISRNAASAEIRLQNNTISSYIRSNTDNLNFYVSNGEKVRITSGGNVGIGTTSPAYKLDVNGTMRIAGNEDATNLRIAANLATVSGTAYQNYNELLFENTSATYGNAGIRHLGNAWLDSKSALAFFTSSNTGSFDERMRINASGNVGIGTTSPIAKLDVNGATRIGGKTTYTKGYPSLDTTGNAVAGLVSSFNGASAMFIFTCYGHTGSYQRIVYSCWNTSGTSWNVKKVIDEGDNQFDITVDAVGATRTFTFVSRSGTASYSPNVTIEHVGAAIDTSYL